MTDSGGGTLSLDTSSGDANSVDVAASTNTLAIAISTTGVAVLKNAVDISTSGAAIDVNAAAILVNAVDISTVNTAKVSKAGDTMSGTLDMDDNEIVAVSTLGVNGSVNVVSTVTAKFYDSSGTDSTYSINGKLLVGLDEFADTQIHAHRLLLENAFGPRLRFRNFGSSNGRIEGRIFGGTEASPSAISSGKTMFQISAEGGEDVSGNVGSGPMILFRAEEDFSPNNNGSSLEFRTVANGTDDRILVLVIQEDGDTSLENNDLVNVGTVDGVDISDHAANADAHHTATVDTFVTGKDSHDHDGGDGAVIPAGGIDSNAITTAKIADAAVTSVKLSQQPESLARVSGGVMTSDGTNIGINEASPNATLEVKANLADQFTLQISSQDGSVVFVIDKTGKIGIGALPGAALEIARPGANIQINDTTGTNPNLFFQHNGSNKSNLQDISGALTLTSAASADMTLNVSVGQTISIVGGDFGVNETNPNARFEVKAALADQFTLQISSQNGSSLWNVDRLGLVEPPSFTIAELKLIAPRVLGQTAYCSDCTLAGGRMVESTGTSAGEWADADGSNWD